MGTSLFLLLSLLLEILFVVPDVNSAEIDVLAAEVTSTETSTEPTTEPTTEPSEATGKSYGGIPASQADYDRLATKGYGDIVTARNYTVAQPKTAPEAVRQAAAALPKTGAADRSLLTMLSVLLVSLGNSLFKQR